MGWFRIWGKGETPLGSCQLSGTSLTHNWVSKEQKDQLKHLWCLTTKLVLESTCDLVLFTSTFNECPADLIKGVLFLK